MIATILNPLLQLPLFLSILILSFAITLLTTLIYKWTTNQKLMKELKEETKTLQKLLKEYKNEPDKAMEVNQKLMATNTKYFMHSMKPLLFTMLPVIIIFGWMQSSLAYEPIQTGKETSITITTTQPTNTTITVPEGITLTSSKQKEGTEATFTITPTKEGTRILTFEANKETAQKDILVTTKRKYINPTQTYKGTISQIKVQHEKAIALNLFGWKLGWLGTYIILSIAFSTALRKILNVY